MAEPTIDPTTAPTTGIWRVRVIRDFFWIGVLRQVGDLLDVPEHVARGMIEGANAVNTAWPANSTTYPWVLQGGVPVPSGAGVASINGIDGSINIVAGPNIVVTTGASSITVGAPNVVPTSRQVIAGAGLSGGGPLTGNVTLTANVQSVFGRTGAIVATAGDYNAGQITLSPVIGTWTNVQQAITALATAPPGIWQEGTGGAIYYTAGHVGIGTSTPVGKLTVVGDATSHGIWSQYYSNAVGEASLWLQKGRGTSTSPLPVQAGDWLTYLGFGGQVANLPPQNGAEVASIQTVVTSVTPNNLAGDMVISTNDGTGPNGAGYERMRITHDGFVAIGTDDPTMTLDVLGTGAIDGQTLTHPGTVRFTAAENDCRLILNTVESPGYSAIAFHYGGGSHQPGGAYMGELGADVDGIMLYTADSVAIWATPAGRVWIGDQVAGQTPQFALDVNGGVNAKAFYIDGVLFAGTGAGGFATGGAASLGATAPTTPQEGQFWFNTSTMRLNIRYSGTWFQI